MRRPVNSPYTITTEFGVPDSYALFGYHSGVDYAVPSGRPIYAPASGTVQNIVSRTGGNMVVLYDGQFYHRLMHNSSFSVPNGSRVAEGQEVAKCGSTGLSTGPHCHWDINVNGSTARSFADFRSPADWLAGKFVTTQGDEMISTRDQAVKIYQLLRPNGNPSEAEITGTVGRRTFASFLNDAQAEVRIRNANLLAQAQALQAARTAIDSLSVRPTKEEYARVQAIVNDKAVEIAVLQAKLEEAQNRPAVIKEVEVEPSWLRTAIDFIRDLLRIKE